MRTIFRTLTIQLTLTAMAVLGQSKPAFAVATVKPVVPMDQATMLAALQSGRMPYGANINSRRAEYTYLDLKALLTYAYGVKPYEIAGPDWMATTRFPAEGLSRAAISHRLDRAAQGGRDENRRSRRAGSRESGFGDG